MADTYTTRDLANAVIGKDDKAATRELRKFLRAEAINAGGKVGTDTPGKGGRYALQLTKREITAMKKKFTAWQIEQAEAKKERAEKAAQAIKAKAEETVNEVETDIEDEMPESPEEPTSSDIDAMLRELDNEDEVDEDLESV